MRRPAVPDPRRRASARVVYGADPIAYEAGRPEYPDRVYEILKERCGLGPGRAALEIGPGTGRVTRRLLAAGADVTGVEPDAALAAHLATTLPDVAIVATTFEDAPLPMHGFDLVAAAMSFHWVDLDRGLPKLGNVLRFGGWAALWWTRFGDPRRDDPFGDAMVKLLGQGNAAAPFELDVAGWRSALEEGAGLTDFDAEVISWDKRMDPTQARAFFASTIAVLERDAADQARLLDAIEQLVLSEFGGIVEQPCVTATYTVRRGAPKSGAE